MQSSDAGIVHGNEPPPVTSPGGTAKPHQHGLVWDVEQLVQGTRRTALVDVSELLPPLCVKQLAATSSKRVKPSRLQQ
jgi:hypothetical protein